MGEFSVWFDQWSEGGARGTSIHRLCARSGVSAPTVRKALAGQPVSREAADSLSEATGLRAEGFVWPERVAEYGALPEPPAASEAS